MARILIVDDDDDLRESLVRALGKFGHETCGAGSGHEAMAALRAEPLDLVVTDINMPDMDGIEVINELSAAHPTVPVVAMSGGGRLPTELLLGSADLLGAVETIEKPFELSVLLETISRALRRDRDGS